MDKINSPGQTDSRTPYCVRLPGFVTDREVGLGDAITHATSMLGIRQCSGCQQRSAVLSRWLVFSGRPADR